MAPCAKNTVRQMTWGLDLGHGGVRFVPRRLTLLLTGP